MSDLYHNGDFLRIQALMTQYVWALDMGDMDGLMALFDEPSVFQDTAGNEYTGHDAIRGYFTDLTRSPAFRGRQHHIDSMLVQTSADGYAAHSYWTVTKWRAADGQKLVEVVGRSWDRFRTGPKGFLIAERRVFHWRDADCPWQPSGTAVYGKHQ
jgi:hypothetical protein